MPSQFRLRDLLGTFTCPFLETLVEIKDNSRIISNPNVTGEYRSGKYLSTYNQS
jgi:hypothetical protein